MSEKAKMTDLRKITVRTRKGQSQEGRSKENMQYLTCRRMDYKRRHEWNDGVEIRGELAKVARDRLQRGRSNPRRNGKLWSNSLPG